MNHGHVGRHRPRLPWCPTPGAKAYNKQPTCYTNRSMLLKLEYLIFINTNYLVSAGCVINASHGSHIVLLAATMNAATNIAPAPHPLQHQTKRYILAMFYCLGGIKRCLEEVQITPQLQPSSYRQNSLPTWCRVIRTRHHQSTTPGADTIQTHGPHHE